MTDPTCAVTSYSYGVYDSVTILQPDYLTMQTDSFVVATYNTNHVGNHSLILSYYMTFDAAETISRTVLVPFNLEIKPVLNFTRNFGPPFFIQALDEITMQEGESLDY